MTYFREQARIDFACIYASLQATEDWLVQANQRTLASGSVVIRRCSLQRSDPAFGPPAHSPLRQGVFFSPRTWRDGCILKSNASDGWHPLIYQLSVRLRCRTILWQLSSPEAPRSSFVNAFYLNVSGGNVERVVRCMVEENGRLEFFSRGQPQPFEKLDYYSRHRVQDRLNQSVLLEYLRTLGLEAEDDSFWSSDEPGALFATTQP